MRSPALTLLVFLGLLSGSATAQIAPPEFTPPLGSYHVIVDFDAMYLQHQTFETDESGFYVGLAGYGHIGRGWYLGGEIGAGSGFNIFATNQSSYMPLELNAKKGFALSSWCAVDLGAGLSYSRVSFSHDNIFRDGEETEITEWVFGGQILGGLMFKTGPMLIGLRLKYQLTADAQEVATLISPDEGWDYSNFKIGLQIGFQGSQ